jgi:hypothetical protein
MFKKIIILLLILVTCLSIKSYAQYVDKTPMFKVGIFGNIYNTSVGGSLSSGTDWFFLISEQGWSTPNFDLGTVNVYDSLCRYANYSPSLRKHWATYSNATQCIYRDTAYLNAAFIFDSLAGADGTDDDTITITGGRKIVWEDMFVHIADSTILFGAGTRTEKTISGNVGYLLDDETGDAPETSILTALTALKDDNLSTSALSTSLTDYFSVGGDFGSDTTWLDQILIKDISTGDSLDEAYDTCQIYTSIDNSTWILYSGIHASRDAVTAIHTTTITLAIPVRTRYWKAHFKDGLRTKTGNPLNITEVMTYSNEIRLINADSLRIAGRDSLTRFPIFSGGAWGNVAGGTLYPTGKEHLFNLYDSVVANIVARANTRIMDEHAAYLGVDSAIYSLGYDNMLIGNAGYGTNQSSYWSSSLKTSTGGQDASNVEWDITIAGVNCRPLIAPNPDSLSYGYINVCRETADLFGPKGYFLPINLSNTTNPYLKRYADIANDSVLRFELEMRGGDLVGLTYTSAGFQNVIKQVDTLYKYAKTSGVGIDYRMITSTCWAGDVWPTQASCTSADTLTHALGNILATKALTSFLWVMHPGHTSFKYGRNIFANKTIDGTVKKWNWRWYKLFELDLGNQIDSSLAGRIDSIKTDTSGITGRHVLLRKYDRGLILFMPVITDLTADTIIGITRINLGQAINELKANGPDAVDTVYNDSGVIYIAPGTGRIFKYVDQAPSITDRTQDTSYVGTSFNIQYGVYEESEVCSLKVYFNDSLLKTDLMPGGCVADHEIPEADTVIAYTPVAVDTGLSHYEVKIYDDSGHVRDTSISVYVDIPNVVTPQLITYISGGIDTVDVPDTIFYSMTGNDIFIADTMWFSINNGTTYPYLVGYHETEPTDTFMVWTPSKTQETIQGKFKLRTWSHHPSDPHGDISRTTYNTTTMSYIWIDTTIDYFGWRLDSGTIPGYQINAKGSLWLWKYTTPTFSAGVSVFLDSAAAWLTANGTGIDTVYYAIYKSDGTGGAPKTPLARSIDSSLTNGVSHDIPERLRYSFDPTTVLESNTDYWVGLWVYADSTETPAHAHYGADFWPISDTAATNKPLRYLNSGWLTPEERILPDNPTWNSSTAKNLMTKVYYHTRTNYIDTVPPVIDSIRPATDTFITGISNALTVYMSDTSANTNAEERLASCTLRINNQYGSDTIIYDTTYGFEVRYITKVKDYLWRSQDTGNSYLVATVVDTGENVKRDSVVYLVKAPLTWLQKLGLKLLSIFGVSVR